MEVLNLISSPFTSWLMAYLLMHESDLFVINEVIKPCECLLVSGFGGSRTGLWGTLWQVKSQMHRSSSVSSSHTPPNMLQRFCSQVSTPEPDPPEPQSATEGTTSTSA